MIICASSAAGAYDFDSEYRSITELESFAIDSPKKLDSEYSMNQLSYRLRPQWYAKTIGWPTAEKSTAAFYQTTTGSLDGSLFFTNSRAQMRSLLQDNFEFRLVHLEDRSYEVDQVHTTAELSARMGENSNAWISLYGSPSKFKRENDAGLALVSKRIDGNKKHESRLYVTWVDLVRSERSDRGDTFPRGSEPYIIGFVDRGVEGKRITEFAIRTERPLRWKYPALTQDFYYDNWTISGLNVDPDSDGYARIFQIQWDQSRKWIDNFGSSSVEGSFRDRLSLLLAREFNPTPTPLHYAEFGMEFVTRFWRINEGTLGIPSNEKSYWQNVFQPYLIFHRLIPRPKRTDRAEIGMIGSYFRDYGDPSVGTADRKEKALEGRLDFRYAWVFSEKAELILAAGFDLDSLFNPGSFEGGNGQFRWEF